MRATMQDVARRAGVSVKTVSNVLTGYRYLRPETRAKVEKAIAELDYRVNVSARNLRSQRTSAITLALPEVRANYFARLAQNVVDESERRGLTVFVESTGGVRERELLTLNRPLEGVSDGVLLVARSLTSDDFTHRNNLPIVLLGEHLRDAPVDHASVDNERLVAESIRHLIELGRRRIALIGFTDNHGPRSSIARLHAAIDTLRRQGAEAPDDLVVAGGDYPNYAAGASAVRELVNRGARFDALFAFNDPVALGALIACRQAGISVPNDVAVMGVDGSDEAAIATPPLSTAALDLRAAAKGALDLLERRWTVATSDKPASVDIPFSLVLRESTLGSMELSG